MARKKPVEPGIIEHEPQAQPVAHIHTLHPDLVSTFHIFRKAAAFDNVCLVRGQLRAVKEEIQRLVKKTGGKQQGEGSMMSQLLGQKQALEEAIEIIYWSFKGE